MSSPFSRTPIWRSRHEKVPFCYCQESSFDSLSTIIGSSTLIVHPCGIVIGAKLSPFSSCGFGRIDFAWLGSADGNSVGESDVDGAVCCGLSGTPLPVVCNGHPLNKCFRTFSFRANRRPHRGQANAGRSVSCDFRCLNIVH